MSKKSKRRKSVNRKIEAISSNPRRKVKIDGGQECRHCKVPMQRHAHPEGWKPLDPLKGYYLYWDKCPACNRLFMYPEAFVQCEKILAAEKHAASCPTCGQAIGKLLEEELTRLGHFRSI